MKTVTVLASLLALTLPLSAAASPPSANKARVTEFKLDTYGKPYAVRRTRSAGKQFAKFQAEPSQIAPDAVLLFEVQSISDQGVTPRWRCVALDNVADCLGRTQRFSYLLEDDRIELTITAELRTTPAGQVLVSEALSNPAGDRFAQVRLRD